MLRCMSDTESAFVTISQRMESLRRRIIELDAERAQAQEEIGACMRQLASMADRNAAPGPDAAFRDHILWSLRRNRARAVPMAPSDIVYDLKLTNRRDEANVRTLLARMAKEGRVKRVAHGRYVINEE
jgi:hypothetical protein